LDNKVCDIIDARCNHERRLDVRRNIYNIANLAHFR